MNTVKATINEVISDKGIRVYKLSLSEPIGRSGCVQLLLAGHEDQAPFFFHVENGNVLVNVHHCTDTGNPEVYYVWQPRLPGKPSACPRCKTRMDIIRNSRT